MTKPNVFTPCPTGLELYQRFIELADKYNLGHPQVSESWDAWILHKRGTAQAKGCETCNGLKPRAKNAAQSREG